MSSVGQEQNKIAIWYKYKVKAVVFKSTTFCWLYQEQRVAEKELLLYNEILEILTQHGYFHLETAL